MSHTQPVTPSTTADQRLRRGIDAASSRLQRDIESMLAQHSDASGLAWNTYFDELVQRARPAMRRD
jgi:hypothetical protein